MLDASGSEPATSYCHLEGARLTWWKLELRKDVYLVGWYGISSTVLDYLLRGNGTCTAAWTAKYMSLVPSAHRAIGKNIEIFSGKKLRHFVQKKTSEGQNCIRKILCLEAATLLTLPFFFFFELIYGWRKLYKYFFIPSSWTGKTTEWLCKPLNYEMKYSWQKSVLRSCSLAPLTLAFCIRTDWPGAD